MVPALLFPGNSSSGNCLFQSLSQYGLSSRVITVIVLGNCCYYELLSTACRKQAPVQLGVIGRNLIHGTARDICRQRIPLNRIQLLL